MKAKDVKTDVVYGYRTSEHDVPKPVRVVIPQVCMVRRYRDYNTKPTDPCVVRPKAGDRWSQRAAVRDGFGMPAVSTHYMGLGRGNDKDPGPVSHLLHVTVDDVMATTIDDTAFHRPVPGHVRAHLTVIDPRYIMGEWDAVWQIYCEEREMARQAQEEKSRQQVADRDAFIAREQRLVDLGVRRRRTDVRFGAPPDMALTFEEFERLMSLVPEGAQFEEPWEYPEPEGISTRR